jgi:hypothetical protein
VVKAVLELDEPYRSTVLLRYYEDLPPRDIAKAMKIPVETVRTRLKRSLALLRAGLDAEHRGRSWCLALAPVAGLRISPAAPLSAAAVTISVALACVIGASLVFWSAFLSPGEKEAAPPEKETVQRLTEKKAPPSRTVADRIPVKPASTRLSGKVLNESTGLPVSDFQVHLVKDGENLAGGGGLHTLEHGGDYTLYVDAPGLPITHYQLHLIRDHATPVGSTHARAAVDENGRYAFTLDEEGDFTLYVEAPGYIPPIPVKVHIPAQTDFTIMLKPWQTLSGTVVEHATGRPVPGALVAAQMVSSDFHGYNDCVETDEEGRFRLTRIRRSLPDGKRPCSYRIAASHPDFAQACVEAGAGDSIELRLEPGYRISGTINDSDGLPVQDAELFLYGERSPVERIVTTDALGRYITPPCRPGRLNLTAVTNSVKVRRSLALADRDLEVDFGGLDTVRWYGTVHDSEGRPATGGAIELCSEDTVYSVPLLEGGRFEASGMPPGFFEVRLHLEGEDWGKDGFPWETVCFEDPGLVHRDIHLPMTEITGLLVDEETGLPVKGGTYWIKACPAGRPDRQYLKKAEPDGTFRLSGLAPDVYSLGATALFDDTRLGYAPSCALVSRPVFLFNHQAVHDLRPVLPMRGRLCIRIEGLDDPVTARIYSVDGTPHGTFNPASGRSALHWEVGSWVLVLEGVRSGRLEKPFKIFRNMTTSLVIEAGDFPGR